MRMSWRTKSFHAAVVAGTGSLSQVWFERVRAWFPKRFWSQSWECLSLLPCFHSWGFARWEIQALLVLFWNRNWPNWGTVGVGSCLSAKGRGCLARWNLWCLRSTYVFRRRVLTGCLSVSGISWHWGCRGLWEGVTTSWTGGASKEQRCKWLLRESWRNGQSGSYGMDRAALMC